MATVYALQAHILSMRELDYIIRGNGLHQQRLWDAERSCIGIGKGHLRVVGFFDFSNKTKNFFLLVAVGLLFSFFVMFVCLK